MAPLLVPELRQWSRQIRMSLKSPQIRTNEEKHRGEGRLERRAPRDRPQECTARTPPKWRQICSSFEICRSTPQDVKAEVSLTEAEEEARKAVLQSDTPTRTVARASLAAQAPLYRARYK